MKEKYTAPELEMISLGNHDIITESTGPCNPPVSPDIPSPWSNDSEG